MTEAQKANGKVRRIHLCIPRELWTRLEAHCERKEKRIEASVTYAGEISRMIDKGLKVEEGRK